MLKVIYLFDFLMIQAFEEETNTDRQFTMVWSNHPPIPTEENPNLNDWADFQVFLDFDVDYNPAKLPDCHGIILTSQLVLSRATCISTFGGYGEQHNFNFLRVIKVSLNNHKLRMLTEY